MKYIFWGILFIFSQWFNATGQTLVVGAEDPKEVVTISTDQAYDSIMVKNNAILNIVGGNVSIKQAVILSNQAQLNVQNATYANVGTFILTDTSSAILTGSIALFCDILTARNARLFILGANVEIPMLFKSQFSWNAFDNSQIEVSYCQFNLGQGALAGEFSGNSEIDLNVVSFATNQLPFTWALQDFSIAVSDSVFGGQEFTIDQHAQLSITNADAALVWYSFQQGDTADYSYPPPNGSVPNASAIVDSVYQFDASLEGISGVDFRVTLNNISNVFWGILMTEGAEVRLSNSTVLSSGFIFSSFPAKRQIASNFVNDSTYTDFTAPFSDRTLSLNNSKLVAWNFYTAGGDELTIEDSFYGESWAFDNSILRINHSVCDGTGGSVTLLDNGQLFADHSRFFRASGDAQILNIQQDALVSLSACQIEGNVSVSGNAWALLNNTTFDTPPTVTHNALFSAVVMDTMPDIIGTHTTQFIRGSLELIRGPENNRNYSTISLAYSQPDTSDIRLISETPFSDTSFEGELASWTTSDVPAGDYLLWLIVLIDNDTAHVISQPVKIDVANSISDQLAREKLSIYPMSFEGRIKVESNEVMEKLSLFDMSGREIKKEEVISTRFELDAKPLPAGLYVLAVAWINGANTFRKVWIP